MITLIQELFQSSTPMSCMTFDVGNTHLTRGVWTNGHLTQVSKTTLEDVNGTGSDHLISSVRKEISSTFEFNPTFFGMPVNYQNTLGNDRLVTSHLVFDLIKNDLSPDKAILIDAGTFVTIDFISNKGFEGGYILPGPETLLKSYLRGEQLSGPSQRMVVTNSNDQKKLPETTIDAIEQGVLLLLKSTLNEISHSHPNHIIYLTGGASDLCLNYIPRAKVQKNLVHYALYNLLRHSEKSSFQ